MFQSILCPVDGSDHADKALALAGDLASHYGARLTVMHVVNAADPRSTSELRHFAESEGLSQQRPGPRMPAGGSADEVIASAHTLARDTAESAEIAARAGEQLLQHVWQRARLDAQGDSVLAHGSPAHAILEEARERDVDAIVMGSRGRGNVKSLLLGSVSSEVSNQARCTCITVK